MGDIINSMCEKTHERRDVPTISDIEMLIRLIDRGCGGIECKDCPINNSKIDTRTYYDDLCDMLVMRV